MYLYAYLKSNVRQPQGGWYDIEGSILRHMWGSDARYARTVLRTRVAKRHARCIFYFVNSYLQSLNFLPIKSRLHSKAYNFYFSTLETVLYSSIVNTFILHASVAIVIADATVRRLTVYQTQSLTMETHTLCRWLFRVNYENERWMGIEHYHTPNRWA